MVAPSHRYEAGVTPPTPNVQVPHPPVAGPPAAPAIAGASPSARTIWIDLLLYPTHSLPTAIAPVLVGAGLAAHDGVLAPLPALVGFLGSWLIHVAGVFTDNHELLRKHPGLPEHPELTQAVRDGSLRLSRLRAAIAACLAVALVTAPYLYGVGGAPVLALGAVGVASSVSYNGGPWAYVRRGLADPVFLLMFGVVAVVGTYYIQVAAVRGAPSPWRLLCALPPSAFLVGLPAGAIVTSVMLIDDVRDREFDAAKGWRTGAVRFGAAWAGAEIALLVAFAYLAPVAFWLGLGFDAWVLLPLATAPLAWRTVKGVRAHERRSDLAPLTPRMARLAAVHSLLLAVGLAASR
jgi:1,4-dihydroxy-2-naphthoate octaprenyltransferase